MAVVVPCAVDEAALGVAAALVSSPEEVAVAEADSVLPVVVAVAEAVVSAAVEAAAVSAVVVAVVDSAVVVVVVSAGADDRSTTICGFARLLVSLSPRKKFPRGKTTLYPCPARHWRCDSIVSFMGKNVVTNWGPRRSGSFVQKQGVRCLILPAHYLCHC